MKATLYLKDGSTSTIFTFKQFLDMVQDYMGDDVAKWLEGHCSALEKAADRTAAAIDTDLASYEASLESNARAFQDIQDEAAAIMNVLQGKRINRAAITYSIRLIGQIISDQI
ncbi:hypothetical protein [Acutalibacter caecimuris]|uniref:hypothetical protein n=1 Tax=Acutalibacter caecimuris TaxID=3093657 RepID=UPI002AC9B66B|nr:hypothetical protein [Acutalibacter sp. M00118]